MGIVAWGEEEMTTATSNAQRPTSNVQWAEPKTQSTILWRILAIVIGGLFVYAGALKAWDPVRFAGDIQNYHVLPWVLNVSLAFYLPWLEMLCGLGLIVRRLYSGVLALLFALLLVFIGASIAAKVRGIDISCGCFGHVSDQLSFAWHMVLDFAILAAVAALWRWDARSPRVAE
jgi:putative oxidoreductase